MIEITAMSAVAGGQILPANAFLGADVAVSIVDTTATAAIFPLMQMADAAVGYARQPGRVTIQTLGSVSNTLFASGDVSGDVVDGSALRIGRVADPDDAAKWCWRMRCAETDADTSGSNAKRAEFSFPAGIGYGEFRTIGFKYRIADYAGHTDEFIIAQIHAGASSSLVNPWLAFIIDGNETKVLARFDNLAVSTVLFAHRIAQWNAVVIEAKYHASAGSLMIWFNGNLTVSYSGPLGEETARYDSYLKSGIYAWDANTQWDDTYPVREIYAKGPYLANGAVASDMHALIDDL